LANRHREDISRLHLQHTLDYLTSTASVAENMIADATVATSSTSDDQSPHIGDVLRNCPPTNTG
jgi:hypothetical protein